MLSKNGLKSRAHRLQDFMIKGMSNDEDREVPGGHPTPQRQIGISIREPSETAVHQGGSGRGRDNKGKRPLLLPPPHPPSKKQHLKSLEPKHVLRDSLRVKEESPMVPVQESRIIPSCKEAIPLDQDDDEKQVDYEPDDTDTHLSEPIDIGFSGNIGDSSYMLANGETDLGIKGKAVPSSFLASGKFELRLTLRITLVYWNLCQLLL
ncbi:uncharacterized protein A4U43_C09F10610 [Asparagus officinalis]|uniref:Uncharacterized protein n=1 Tax=Asparagus officinalis TaxID=4686 RepID=A0A5P1EBJ3_ASPOF|nr:uncharacterized protein A4U43_C09F10610 [Asparagus officinalis]